MINRVNLLIEKYIKGSQRMILYARNFNDAYNEALDIVLTEFGYQQSDVEIKVYKDQDKVDFYRKDYLTSTHAIPTMNDWISLGKMKKDKEKYTLTLME